VPLWLLPIRSLEAQSQTKKPEAWSWFNFKIKVISNVMNKIRMIQSEEKSHFKLSQIEERSQKASRHETISDETETET